VRIKEKSMKTRYLSIENIDEESLRMLQKLPDHEGRRISRFDPSNSALLVLDMQNYFLDPSSHAYIPSAEAIVPGLRALARAYFEKDLPVIFTQHLNTPEDAGSMGTWWRDMITVDDPLSAIIHDFDFSNRFVLRKNQYDAFYETSLEEILHKKGITQVVISGVMTHLCCETTARSAFVRGFEVFFVIDGTATYNEDYHMATLLNLAHGFSTPVLTNEVLKSLHGIPEKNES
jgi:isochorismate hydrolase